MGEAKEEARRRAMESLSLEIEKYPRDLLQRFTCINNTAEKEKSNEEEEEDEIELNLGLSLGGRFGVDKSKKKQLLRSSSIAGTIPVIRDDDVSFLTRKNDNISYMTTVLARTSSLPTETEGEWRKRKELQTLRRMEAKRRRLEKQRIFKVEKEDERKEIEGAMRLNFRDNKQQSLSLPVALPFGMPTLETKPLQAQGILILPFFVLFMCVFFFLMGELHAHPVRFEPMTSPWKYVLNP
jgi:hypothetical protein